jgi:hypothetical protein
MICEIFFEHVHNLLLCDALEIAAPKAQRKHHIKIGQGRHSTPHFTWKGTGKGITIDRDVSCCYIASHCATAQKLRVRLRRALRLRKSVLSPQHARAHLICSCKQRRAAQSIILEKAGFWRARPQPAEKLCI